jgi:hypothetical protein
MKRVGFLKKIFAKIITAPFRITSFLSGPATYNQKESDGEGPQTATARYLLAHGIKSNRLSQLQIPGINEQQLKELAEKIEIEEKAHPTTSKYLEFAFSAQQVGFTQAQIANLLAPAPNKPPAVLPKKSFLGNIFGRIGQQLFGKATNKVLKKATEKVVEKATSAISAKVGAAIGSTIPGLGTAVGWLVGKVGGKIISKLAEFFKKHKEKIIAAGLVISGLIIGGPVGLALMAGGGLIGLGALAGGFGAVGAGIGGIVNTAILGLTSIVLPAIGAPIIAALVSIPIIIAVILFIINSGAYLVPPKPATFSGIIESPYIGVEKTATPDCLNRENCPNLPNTIKYTIKITAKKGTLTNINFDNKYQVLGEGSESDLPKAPEIERPEIISPVKPFVFTYSLDIDQKLNNSVIIDTLTVTANAPDQKGSVASDVASVIIGNPPASSCPILGASVYYPSYNGSVDPEIGHGSNAYWSTNACGYDIPAFSGCFGPTKLVDPDKNNVCRSQSGLCNHYGYASDIKGPANTLVFLPSIFGESLNWKFKRRVSIAGGNWGYGYLFSSGKYDLYLGHLNKTVPPDTAESGTPIGTLFPGLTNPHVHVELQINGQWVRPDFLCGGVGP